MSLNAIPAALALGFLFHVLTPGLQRIFFGMPVHEMGHAVAAWLCGYLAIPTLWKTVVFEGRGFFAPLALAGALIYLLVRAWRAEEMAYVALIVAVLLLQAFGTLVLREETALMASFFFYNGSVRWGLLLIGAAAFADMSPRGGSPSGTLDARIHDRAPCGE